MWRPRWSRRPNWRARGPTWCGAQRSARVWPLTVIQLVGRDPEAMAQGARMAEAAGADIVDLNFGCPAQGGDWGGVGFGLDAQSGPGLPADGGRGGGDLAAGDGQDAAGVGRRSPERRRPGATGRGPRHRGGDRARTDAAAVLFRGGGLARGRRGQGGGGHSGHRQWRRDHDRGRPRGAGSIGGRWSDARARGLWPALAGGAPGSAAGRGRQITGARPGRRDTGSWSITCGPRSPFTGRWWV